MISTDEAQSLLGNLNNLKLGRESIEKDLSEKLNALKREAQGKRERLDSQVEETTSALKEYAISKFKSSTDRCESIRAISSNPTLFVSSHSGFSMYGDGNTTLTQYSTRNLFVIESVSIEADSVNEYKLIDFQGNDIQNIYPGISGFMGADTVEGLKDFHFSYSDAQLDKYPESMNKLSLHLFNPSKYVGSDIYEVNIMGVVGRFTSHVPY